MEGESQRSRKREKADHDHVHVHVNVDVDVVVVVVVVGCCGFSGVESFTSGIRLTKQDLAPLVLVNSEFQVTLHLDEP